MNPDRDDPTSDLEAVHTMKDKPSEKKSRHAPSPKKRQNQRARKYRTAAKSILEGHDLYALDLVSRAAVVADLLLCSEDVDVRLTAISRALRAGLALIEVDDAVNLRKRIEVIEERLQIKL